MVDACGKFGGHDEQAAAIDAELGLSIEDADALKDLHTAAVRRMVRSGESNHE